MVYTIQKHLQNIFIGCVAGMLTGILFGVYSAWVTMPNSKVWILLVPIFVTLIYFLVILYPTYGICKYLHKKDKQIQNENKK